MVRQQPRRRQPLRQRQQLSADDYARAEQFLPWHVRARVRNAEVRPHWLAAGTANAPDAPNADAAPNAAEGAGAECFWYERQTRDGTERVLVNVRTGAREPLPDDLANDPGVAAAADPLGGRLAATLAHGLLSPDGRWAVSASAGNLILRDMESEKTRALTDDGQLDHAYGKAPDSNTFTVTARLAGLPLPPMALWSPDSRRLLCGRLDEREVAELHLLQSAPPDGRARPALHSYRYAMPGDRHVPTLEWVVFDIESGGRVDARHPPFVAPVMTPIEGQQAWWSEDSSRVYFIEPTRGSAACRLCELDPSTGTVRVVIEESGDCYVELTPDLLAQPNVRVISGGREVIWFSERDGWGHLYLHDAATGKLLHPITSGEWLVREIIRIDEETKQVFFTASGRESGRDPYSRHLYRIDLDGSNLTLLTPEDGDHQIHVEPANDIIALAQVALLGGSPSEAGFSPSGRAFIDTWSRMDTPSVSVLRTSEGALICTLETADVSELIESGWRWPEPVRVKARDGETDLYGALYRPSNFDPEKNYPVIDMIYPGPQVIRTPKQSFPSDRVGVYNYTMPQALAELGFVVVTLDGLGTPLRSRAFREFAYGRMEDAGGLEDHVTGLRQLAAERPYMDIDRVGITGHSGGGFASTRAILAHPDFFRVAVSSAGNHDQRGYTSFWGEKYQGMLESVGAEPADDSAPVGEERDNYEAQINARLADRLEGKLLLITGDMDDNVHPALTFQVADALIAANKDFDLLVLPNRNHQSSLLDPYVVRRLWDYFVSHLLCADPPSGYRIRGPVD